MAGVNRKTIQRHVSNGKLSAIRDNNGKPFIELSELLRVYPNLSHPDVDKMSHGVPQGQLDRLIKKIESLESLINDLSLRLDYKPTVEEPIKTASEPSPVIYDDGVMTLNFDDLSIDNNLDMLNKK